MAKLSKTKEYAVKYLHSQNKSVEEIAAELKVPLKTVKELCKPPKVEKPKDKTKDLMIRQTAGKKMNSVSIMTEAAAQLGDEFMKGVDAIRKRTESFIFRPRD